MNGRVLCLYLGLAPLACGGKTPLRVGDEQKAPEGAGGSGEGGSGGSGGDMTQFGGAEPAGGEAGSGGSPIAIPQICAEYCEAEAIKDCPPAPDCEVNCALMFGGECQDAATAFLSCAPAQTMVDCNIGYGSDGPSQACDEAASGLWNCGSCDAHTADAIDGGCKGFYDCGLATECDLNGACTCEILGFWVGNCNAIIGGIDACSVNLSCCRMFMFQ